MNEPPSVDSNNSQPLVCQNAQQLPFPFRTTLHLKLCAVFSILIGLCVGFMAIDGVLATLRGKPPQLPHWSLGLGIGLAASCLLFVVGGIATWRRRQWGCWLIFSVVIITLLVSSLITRQAYVAVLVMVWLRELTVTYQLTKAFERLASQLDDVARSLGINWSATPLGRIDELVRCGRKAEAVRLLRENRRCRWSEANAAVARWETDRLTHILQSISEVAGIRTETVPVSALRSELTASTNDGLT